MSFTGIRFKNQRIDDGLSTSEQVGVKTFNLFSISLLHTKMAGFCLAFVLFVKSSNIRANNEREIQGNSQTLRLGSIWLRTIIERRAKMAMKNINRKRRKEEDIENMRNEKGE